MTVDQQIRLGFQNSGGSTKRKPPVARRAGVERGFSDLTAALEPQLKPLSDAVAEYYDQRELLGCAGDIGGAAATINRGLEQLEQSAQDRTRLAAAVDGLLKAFGRQNRQQRDTEQTGALNVEDSSRLVGAISTSDGENSKSSPPTEISTPERYLQIWQQYSQEVNCSNPAELDFKVGRRAFEAGVSQKEIALILAAGSPTVK